MRVKWFDIIFSADCLEKDTQSLVQHLLAFAVAVQQISYFLPLPNRIGFDHVGNDIDAGREADVKKVAQYKG